MKKKTNKAIAIRYAISLPLRIVLATIWAILGLTNKGTEYACDYLEGIADRIMAWTNGKPKK